MNPKLSKVPSYTFETLHQRPETPAGDEHCVNEHTVMDNGNKGLGLSKIVDCAWMAYSPVRNRRSARTVFRRRRVATYAKRSRLLWARPI